MIVVMTPILCTITRISQAFGQLLESLEVVIGSFRIAPESVDVVVVPVLPKKK